MADPARDPSDRVYEVSQALAGLAHLVSNCRDDIPAQQMGFLLFLLLEPLEPAAKELVGLPDSD